MTANPFRSLGLALGSTRSRRATIGLALGAFALLERDQAGAKGRKKKNKKKHEKTRADVTCPGPGLGTLGLFMENRIGQVFTPTRKGQLVRATVAIIKPEGTTGDFALHLATVDAAGKPTNTYLASAQIADASVPVGDAILTFTFQQAAKVASGAPYALVLDRPGTAGYSARLENGMAKGLCGGAAFWSTSATGPFMPISTPAMFNLVFSTSIRA